MNMGTLKQLFDQLDDGMFVFKNAFETPHAYRGYYEEVAFAPTQNVSLYQVKESIEKAMSDIFVGWKGGEYTYDVDTWVNLSFVGQSTEKADDNFEYLVADMLNEYNDAHQTPNKKKRKTAAEKRQEQQAAQDAENAADWEIFKKEYPAKFAALMWDYFKFSRDNYKIVIERVDDDTYAFRSVDGWHTEDFKLSAVPPENYSWEYLRTFRDAEQAIETEREKQREVERKELLKQTALAKLSDEERRVLGL